MNNTEDVILEAIEDAELPPDTDTTEEVDASPAAEAPVEAAPTEDSTDQVSPGGRVAAEPEMDEFQKRFGIPAMSASGRENRIPHSRVTKMIAKAEKELRESLGGEHAKVLTDRDAKIKDYETRLAEVDAFERIMTTDPDKFLQMLSQLPAYSQFFGWVSQMAQGGAQQAAGATNAPDPYGDMPLPTREMPDGSKVYDDEGVRQLLDWNSQRTLQQAQQQFDQKLGPMMQDWESRQYMAKVVPQVEKKLAEARTWFGFKENEAEITKVFNANPQMSIEQAYMHVIQPRLAESDSQKKQRWMQEAQKARPRTGAPTVSSKPNVTPTGTPMIGGKVDTASIIQAEVDKLMGR